MEIPIKCIAFTTRIVCQDTIAGPPRMAIIKIVIYFLHLLFSWFIVNTLIDANSSEIPPAPWILIEDSQWYIWKVIDQHSVATSCRSWMLNKSPNGSPICSDSIWLSIGLNLTAFLKSFNKWNTLGQLIEYNNLILTLMAWSWACIFKSVYNESSKIHGAINRSSNSTHCCSCHNLIMVLKMLIRKGRLVMG